MGTFFYSNLNKKLYLHLASNFDKIRRQYCHHRRRKLPAYFHPKGISIFMVAGSLKIRAHIVASLLCSNNKAPAHNLVQHGACCLWVRQRGASTKDQNEQISEKEMFRINSIHKYEFGLSFLKRNSLNVARKRATFSWVTYSLPYYHYEDRQEHLAT